MDNIGLAGSPKQQEPRGIVLPRRCLVDCNRSPIRVSNEAYAVLGRIQSRTGMSMKALASAIIIQAEDLIVYRDEEDEDDE